MSRFLSNALEIYDPKFRFSIKDLEKKNNHPDHDIKLESEINSRIRNKISELHLDPEDTNKEELYAALKHKLVIDDQKLLKELRNRSAKNINAAANVEDGLVHLLENEFKDVEVFSLKTKIIKQYFKEHPPKNVMKKLDFRSVDSLLKRSHPSLVILAMNALESDTYIKNFYQHYLKLTPTDFENQNIKFVNSPNSKWSSFLNTLSHHNKINYISCYELSSLIILPINNDLKPGQITSITASLIEEINKIRSLSCYIKLSQVNKDFAKSIFNLSSKIPQLEMHLLGSKLSYPLAHKFMNDLKIDINHPLLNKSDLILTKVEDKLCEIIDNFKFWKDNEMLAKAEASNVTSLNIQDVAHNLAQDLKIGDASSFFFKKALKNELLKRYINKEDLKNSFNQNSESSLSIAE